MNLYEILEKVNKIDGSISVDDLKAYLKKLKAKANNDNSYSSETAKSVVEHFRLLKSKNKDASLMIKFLMNEIKSKDDIIAEKNKKIDELTNLLEHDIKGTKSAVDSLNSKLSNFLKQQEQELVQPDSLDNQDYSIN